MNSNMHSTRYLLVLGTLVASFCLVNLQSLSPSPANETVTTTTSANSTTNKLVNVTTNSLSNNTTTTIHLISPLTENGSQNQNKTEEEADFDKYKNSIYYLPAFEEGLKSIPKPHKEYIDSVLDKDMTLFFEILDEAIEKRNKFAPSVSLMWKYASKLVSTCIKNRQGELRINPRKDMSPAFYNMVADLMEKALKMSKEVRREKAYTRKNIDVTQFGDRVRKAFNYIAQTIHSSPLGTYMKWDQLVLYKNEGKPTELLEEASDLVAIFSAMGYDNCLFVARRIVNLLRFFSKGQVPSETEV